MPTEGRDAEPAAHAGPGGPAGDGAGVEVRAADERLAPSADPALGAEPSDGDARRGPPALRGARAAFIFFSRLPVGGFPYATADWHWALAHLPLVGAVVGAASGVALAGLGALGLGPWSAAAAATALSLLLTGALHEDGLADSADALGGAGHDRQRALAILKDSRIGTYGAAALTLSLLTRIAGAAELGAGAAFCLFYVHVWARVGPVWLSSALPYVNERPDAKSRGLLATRPAHAVVALGWGLGATALGVGLGALAWPAAVAGAAAALSSAALLARPFRQRLGGVTGDLLGAAEQVAECACWLALGAAQPG